MSMSHVPLITVIVPVYNVASYLGDCVNSILEQTYPHLQVILVDDGSTDSSGLLCDDYAKRDSRVEVVHKANGGLSSARNAGLSRVRGEFISFVDSDDWLEKTTYARCLEEFDRDPKLDVVSFAYQDEYEDGTSVPYPWRTSRLFSGLEALEYVAYHTKELLCMSWLFLFRSSFLEYPSAPLEVNAPDPSPQETHPAYLQFYEGYLHEDEGYFLLFLGLHPQLRLRCIPDICYHYRTRSGAITSTKSLRNVEDTTSVYELAMRELERYGVGREVQALCKAYVVKMLHVVYMYSPDKHVFNSVYGGG